MNQRLLSLLLAALLGGAGVLGFTGCAVLLVGAAVGTAVYLEGDLESHLATDIYGAVDATNLATRDLQMRPVSRTGDATQATMVATDWEGRKVTIKLSPDRANPRITKISIRVGVGGNEGASRRILDQIQKRVPR